MFFELLDHANVGVSPPLGGMELMKAIGHLHKALELIDGAKIRIEKGVFDGVFTSSDLAEGWFEVNCCRIYTETTIIIEEYLQPAMGLINDAKCMIDSLIAWGLGMTVNGKAHIIGCLDEAEAGIMGVLEELESWVSVSHDENQCPNCGKKYIYGDNFCAACGQKLGQSLT